MTFTPKFLFEQFRKFTNLFFLLVALFQQIPDVSPTGRFTTVIPLAFILLVSAVKEIIEDYARHSADKATNYSKTCILRNTTWQEVLWKDVQVGDIVKLTSHCAIPADLVIIATSECMSVCHIETSNLDGETTLKSRQGLPVTSDLQEPAIFHPKKTLRIECEQPTRSLDKFVGTLYYGMNPGYPLDINQMLLRGATVKNTKWVFGAVVYTGKETKVMLNSRSFPLKRSSIDRRTNYYILVLFFALGFLTMFMVLANILWTERHLDGMWYLPEEGLSLTRVGFMCITAFIIFHTIIPISLQVTLEIVRFVQALYINQDLGMYDAGTDTPAMARTSNLNEDLGQIKYILSDKTGTLTKNEMEFKMCSIGSSTYGWDNRFIPALESRSLQEKLLKGDREVDLFFTILAVCHTVIPEYVNIDINTDEIQYQAKSPDERALVMAAKAVGYVLCERSFDSIKIRTNQGEVSFKLLHVIEFTSDRRRMSVIVEDKDGRLFLMLKGADTVVYQRLSNKSRFLPTTRSNMDKFASRGLRTLCIAFRRLDRDFYEDWVAKYRRASILIANRRTLMDEVYDLIEQDLELVGGTAIEDKLQDNVPLTIANMLLAGIRLWILTGDKQETAVNIGLSCRLISSTQVLLVIDAANWDDLRLQLVACTDKLKMARVKLSKIALIVTGTALEFLLMKDFKKKFFEIAERSSSVICCRVSPWQKAEIVRLIRTFTKGITLAIGDGANDVGMIQAAHVGVGICGLEGRQAACASDYAIAQFQFLNRLLLVHGTWNFKRITKVILYSIYKNICFYAIQLWFNHFTGFSGQILFDRWTLALYNVAFSAAPPLALGLFDQNMSADNCLLLPKLYKELQTKDSFNLVTFVICLVNGVFQSIILFGIPVLAFYNDIAYADGHVVNIMVVGNTIYTCVVVTVCLKAGLEHTTWTVYTHISIWGTILLWFAFLFAYSHLYPTLPVGPEMVGIATACFRTPIFWLLLIIVPLIALYVDLILTFFLKLA